MLVRQNTEELPGIKTEQHDDQEVEQGKQGKEEAGESEKTGKQGRGGDRRPIT